MREGERAGLFEAPASAPGRRLRIDPAWSPARLSGAIIGGVWPWALAGGLLLIVYNAASMVLPAVIGRLVDEVVTPAAAGAAPGTLAGELSLWAAALLGLYLIMNLGYRFGGRLGWYGVQRSQFELTQAILGRILDPRGIAGPTRAPGGLLAVATGDVYRACLVIYVSVYPPGEIAGLLVAAGVLFGVHPGLGLGVVIALPAVLIIMHLLARPLRRRSAAE
ncbi:hypothetical protein, partial [Leucobacter sp. M11]|uniref:hypothetical protein n=1 Tax=Leucobacter sp. M11 TaxID=2993565 RepID=UPI002D7EB6D1